MELGFQSQKMKKKTNSEKLLMFWEMELSSPKFKKRLTFRKITLKSQAKKISYFLGVSKNKFINFSS